MIDVRSRLLPGATRGARGPWSVEGRKAIKQRRTIAIHCLKCRTLLYRYSKGGTGGLVKCFVERIVEDNTAGDLCCPGCGQRFARPKLIGGRTAHGIIQGKVFTRGMRRK